MPGPIDQLRNKLAERLNWDTFTKEIGQGMETLPTPMTVLIPGTIGKFSKLLNLNKQWTSHKYSNLPLEIQDALAFIKTRYPTTFNRAKSIFPLESKLAAGEADIYRKNLYLNEDPKAWLKENPLQVTGHEFGHLVSHKRYPKLVRDEVINNLYRKAFITAPLRNIPLLKEIYWNIIDEIFKHPAEAIPTKYGDAAVKQLTKFMEMSK